MDKYVQIYSLGNLKILGISCQTQNLRSSVIYINYILHLQHPKSEGIKNYSPSATASLQPLV